jgi:hypothetical protein
MEEGLAISPFFSSTPPLRLSSLHLSLSPSSVMSVPTNNEGQLCMHFLVQIADAVFNDYSGATNVASISCSGKPIETEETHFLEEQSGLTNPITVWPNQEKLHSL